MDDFVIEDGILLSYNGTDEEVYVPNGVTIIIDGCFSNASHVKKIYLPNTIRTLGKDSLGRAIVFSENIPSIRSYMFSQNIFHPVYWYWYNEEYSKEYTPIKEEVYRIKERLKQIDDLNKNNKKDNRTMSVSAVLAVVANALLWWQWSWLRETSAWLFGWLPSLFSFAAYVIAFGAIWVGLFFIISMVLLLFFGSADAFAKEKKVLNKQLEKLEPCFQEMSQYITTKNQELADELRVENPVKAEDSFGNMTWHNGMPWNADHANAGDV